MRHESKLTVLDNPLVTLKAAELNRYLQTAPREFQGGPVKHITCRDGTVLSVQASEFSYCSPRNNAGPWKTVEVMFCNKNDKPIYFTVAPDDSYIGGYIPIEDVAKEILARGNARLT